MTELLAAAFGDRPDLMITHVPPDEESRWLAAVTLGGQGWYATAAALLRGPFANSVLGSLAASTRASHLRQLGGHAQARMLDATALGECHEGSLHGAQRPEGSLHGRSPAQASSDALVGLAADALGLGRVPEARRLLAAARRLGETGWRAEIRRCWVSAEIELGAGRPDLAVPHAETAAERAAAAESVRHRVKSGLVLGAALASRGRAGDRARAGRLLADACGSAFGLGLLPLMWPCALLLAELEPAAAPAHRRRAGDALRLILRRADPVARRLVAVSPWMPDPARLTG